MLAQVRYYFGLDQAALAAYLGIAPGLVGHLEAGRRNVSGTVLQRLLPLAQQLPATPEVSEAAESEPPGLVGPASGPLEARLDYCRHHIARLRRELRPLLEAAEVARRWQQALPALLAAAEPGSPAHDWLLRRRQAAAAALDAEASARYHLLRVRAEALEAEGAALTALLNAPADR
ncbi:hypothetical protein B0919_16375 [Hymenobacter sp. CRA2]|nr:hypothetical protein B0919_16375 [Hymenobacter sp. CRA2]